MGATYTKRGAHSWLVTVHYRGERERITVHSKADAEALVQHVYKCELAGANVIETMRQARQERETAGPIVPPPPLPALRDAVPAWLDGQERAGEIRTSTANCYRARLAKWAYPFTLADGRALGDVLINDVTREMLGAL